MSSIFNLLCSVLLAVVFEQVFSRATDQNECVKQQEKCQNCSSSDFFTTKLMCGCLQSDSVRGVNRSPFLTCLGCQLVNRLVGKRWKRRIS